MRLKGKQALVTAAGQGIGRAAALAMATEGAQVLATDVNPELLKAYAGVSGVKTAVLDVLDKQAIAKLVGSLPALDVLFNCAGFVHNGSILEATDKDWDFAFSLNVRAQFWMIQAVLPRMLEKTAAADAGHIDDAGQRLRQHEGSAQSLPLRRLQGGSNRSDQERGSGLCGARHSLQRHLPRHGGHPIFARPYQCL